MAHTPSTSPAEAPEIKSIKELQDKKADTLKYLQDIPGLNDTEKSGFAAEYEAALKALEAKTDADKQKDIGSIKAELQRLKDQLKNEKEDENEEVDEKEDDEPQETGKQKLNVEKEIRGRLDEFKKNIENKLNAPATPEQPTEPVTPEAPSDVKGAQEFFQNKGVKLDTAPVQSNWLKNLFNKLILGWYSMLEGFGIDVRSAKAKLEGYKDYISKQKVEETFKVLSGYMGESIKSITDIKDKEALISKMEGLGLPIMNGDNLLSAPIMQIIFTGDKNVWNNLPDDFDKDILRAIRGKYLTLKDNPKSTGGMNSLQKLNEIFTIEEDRKEEYIERYALDEEERSFTAPKKNPDTIPPVPPLPQETKTPEEEENAEKQRKLSEIEKANTVDKNLNTATKEQPQNNDKINTAKNEREKFKTEVATKIQSIYKKALSDLENVENKLKVSGLSEAEKTKLGEQKKQIETAIAKIKTDAIGLIKDIEKNPAELTEIDAVKAVQIQHVVEDTYKDIEKTYQTKTQTILGEQGQKNKENEAIEAEISTVDGKIQEVVNVIGLDGNKSLTKKEIFATNEKLSEIEELLAKIENDSQGKIEVKAKYDVMKAKYDVMKAKYKFAEVGSIKTDYDEEFQDIGVDKGKLNSVNFKRLIALSPNQEVAYFFVENLDGGKSGYMRLILSEKDSEYEDTGAAFFPTDGKKTIGEEIKDITEIENSAFRDSFFTLELDGTGTWADDNLDWKKQTNWKAKIQALGLIIEK